MNDIVLPLIAGLTSLVLFAGVYVWLALALSAVFRKMGEESWQAWVPVVPIIVFLRRGGYSPWWALALIVPALNVVVAVFLILSLHRVNRGFGHGGGMTALAFLVMPVWATVIGWGSSRWLGADVPRPVLGEQFGGRPTGEAAQAPVDAWSFAPAPSTAPEAPTAAPSLRSTADPLNTVTSSDAPLAPPSWAPTPTGAGYSFQSPTASVAPPPVPSPPAVPQPPATSVITPVITPVVDPVPQPPAMPDIPPAGPVFTAPPVPPAPVPPSVAPIASVPPTPPPMTRAEARGAGYGQQPPLPDDVVSVSAVPAAPEPRLPWNPPVRRVHDDAFDALDSSAEVSAVAGAPRAGAPRSALASVSAQHRRSEIPETDAPLDETVIVARKRTVNYLLTLPAGAPVPVTGEVIIIGRRPIADPAFPGAQLVAVADETRTVSKTHARLELTDRGWVLTDLGSTNGVVVYDADGREHEIEADGIGAVVNRFLLGDAELQLSSTAG